jgi:hypothetical protein
MIQAGKPGRPLAAGDLRSIVARLRMTVPVMSQTKVDRHLRQLVLCTLLKMAAEAGENVPAPKGLLFHPLPTDKFDRYLKLLGTATTDNYKEVAMQLRKIVPDQKVVGTRVGNRQQVVLSDDEDDQDAFATVEALG